MNANKPKLVGLNHIALEVGDVEEPLRFYGSVFEFERRGTHKDDESRTAMAFVDMGDQFLALIGGRTQASDTSRHFGLVVDDRSTVMAVAQAAGATVTDQPFNVVDPWGNHIEIVAYADVQFSKTEAVLRSIGAGAREKRRSQGGASQEGHRRCRRRRLKAGCLVDDLQIRRSGLSDRSG